eukprot:366400-Chlamydomonas_euryale.AAC.19
MRPPHRPQAPGAQLGQPLLERVHARQVGPCKANRRYGHNQGDADTNYRALLIREAQDDGRAKPHPHLRARSAIRGGWCGGEGAKMVSHQTTSTPECEEIGC